MVRIHLKVDEIGSRPILVMMRISARAVHCCKICAILEFGQLPSHSDDQSGLVLSHVLPVLGGST